MQFLTDGECRDCLKGRGLHDAANLKSPSEVFTKKRTISGRIPTVPRLTYFCKAIELALQPYDMLLVWVRQTGIWPSSESLHLYYRLRQSYGDARLLEVAPGHLFLRHESEDARSFIHLAVVSGWDFNLVPIAGYGMGFVSHDEFWELGFDGDEALQTGIELMKGF